MYYDYEDFWAEPSEFEQQVEEFKDALRNAVKDEIKEEIMSLKSELATLKEFRDERHKLIREYEAKIREEQREVEDVKRTAKDSVPCAEQIRISRNAPAKKILVQIL